MSISTTRPKSAFFQLTRRQALATMLAATATALPGLASPVSAAGQKPLKIGIRGGLGEEIWEFVADIAGKNGVPVEIVVITGTASPNEALNNGDLDANAFQHVPFLNDQIRQRGYKLTPVADTIFAPLAIYSQKVKSLADLRSGARIGIPNDPSNETRALFLLQSQGVIKLRDGLDPAKSVVTLADIVDNPKKLEFVESSSVVLARSLPDVDAAAIITSFASQIGLNAARDGIAVENVKTSPFVNVIAVREQDRDAPWVSTLVRSFQSPEVRAFIEKQYAGTIVPAF